MKSTKSSSGSSRKRATAARPAPELDEPLARASDAPQYQTFTVRFLLDPRGACRRTEVTHVQLGVSDAWSDYDPARLERWIGEHLGQPEPVTPAEGVGVSAAPPPAPVNIRAEPRSLNLITPSGRAAGVAAGAPVRTRLELELGGDDSGREVGYRVAAFAQRLGGEQVLLGEYDGQALVGKTTVVEVPGVAPGPGIYRLSAMITLATPKDRAESVLGSLINVYDEGGSS